MAEYPVEPERVFLAGKWRRRCAYVLASGPQAGEHCARASIAEGEAYCTQHKGYSIQKNAQGGGAVKHYPFKEGSGLEASYRKALEDQELLSLRSAVAVVEARIVELIGKLEDDPAARVWQELSKQNARLRRAQEAGDSKNVIGAVSAIQTLIDAGASSQERWEDLFRALELKKEVASAEWKRLADLRCLMTADRAFDMVNRIVDVVLKNVTDNKVKAAINDGVLRIVRTEQLATRKEIVDAQKVQASTVEAALPEAGPLIEILTEDESDSPDGTTEEAGGD